MCKFASSNKNVFNFLDRLYAASSHIQLETAVYLIQGNWKVLIF